MSKPLPAAANHAPSSPASSRSSLAAEPPATSSTTSAPSTAQQRRNRAALRNYYKLAPAAPSTTSSSSAAANPTSPKTPTSTAFSPTSPTTPRANAPHNPLNSPNFDAESYTATLLRTASLTELLQVEAGLVAEMRGLDGERKSLVYDNYSKLIDATETIAGMQKLGGGGGGGGASPYQSRDKSARGGEGALVGGMGTVEPAVAHIESVARELARDKGEKSAAVSGEAEKTAQVARRDAERKTVQWVVSAPDRLAKLVADGQREEADRQWETIARLLEKWNGVQGVEDVRERSKMALEGG